MSVKVISMVFENGPLDLGQHSVMVALADNADDRGLAWPGVELLARKSRLSARQVIRVTKTLELEGWMTVKRRATGEGFRGNIYQLNMVRLGYAKAVELSLDSLGDIVSLGEKEDDASRATSARRSDMVSPRAANCQTAPREVTLATVPSDITLAELVLNEVDALQNRQEPSLEPRTPCSPPLRRGRGSRFAVQGSAGNGNGEGQKLPGESKSLVELRGVEAAVTKVLSECRISNDRYRKLVYRAMDDEHRRTDGPVDWNATAEAMIAMYSGYLSHAHLMRFPVKFRIFVMEGLWLDNRKWPWDEAKVAANRSVMVGMSRRDSGRQAADQVIGWKEQWERERAESA